MTGRARRFVPGVAVLVALGLVARGITELVPIDSELIVVIAIGVAVRNAVGVHDAVEPGVETHPIWLEVAIVLMGATVALERVVAAGWNVLAVVAVAVTATIVTVELLSRTVFGIDRKVGSLLAAGSGICGVSAVVAVAASIEPDRQQVAYAVATILLFDAVLIVAYPLLGGALGLSDAAVGIWIGATMFSTGPATAAGFAHSSDAGEWAVLVKLARNALIGVVAVAYATYYARASETDVALGASLRGLWRDVPTFILGFVAMMVLAGVGAFTQSQVETLEHAFNWLLLFAFAGLGLSIDVRDVRETGTRPIVLVATSLTIVSSLVFLLLAVLF